MMGLYKKDLYLSRKMIIIMAVTFVLLLAFGILWRSAYDYGNLASYPPEDLEYGKSTSEYMFPFITAFLIMCQACYFVDKTIELDIKHHFSLFDFSTTITDKERVKVKLLEILTAFGVGCTSGAVYGLIFGILYGFSNVGVGVLISIQASLILSCFLCVCTPLVYKHKNAMRAETGPAVVLMVLAEGTPLIFQVTGNMQVLENICAKIYKPIQNAGGLGAWCKQHWLLIVIVNVLLYLAFLTWAYFALYRQIKRRERICGAY